MTIDRVNSGARLSGLENLEKLGNLDDGKSKVEGEGGGGEPPKQIPKGQVFKERMGKDMGFIGSMLTGPFKALGNLFKSIVKTKESLDTKQDRLNEIQEKRAILQEQRLGKVRDLQGTVPELFKSIPNTEIYPEKTEKKVNEYYEAVIDNPSNSDKQSTTVDTLKKKDSTTGAKIDKQVEELKNIDNELKALEKEERKLQKLGVGTLIGKVVKAGLATLAAPLASIATGVLIAPFVPIWTGAALLRAGVEAGTGHVIGSPGEQIRNDINYRVMMGLDDD